MTKHLFEKSKAFEFWIWNEKHSLVCVCLTDPKFQTSDTDSSCTRNKHIGEHCYRNENEKMWVSQSANFDIVCQLSLWQLCDGWRKDCSLRGFKRTTIWKMMTSNCFNRSIFNDAYCIIAKIYYCYLWKKLLLKLG